MSALGETRDARRSGSTVATRSLGPRGARPTTRSARSPRLRRGSLPTRNGGNTRDELPVEAAREDLRGWRGSGRDARDVPAPVDPRVHHESDVDAEGGYHRLSRVCEGH